MYSLISQHLEVILENVSLATIIRHVAMFEKKFTIEKVSGKKGLQFDLVISNSEKYLVTGEEK